MNILLENVDKRFGEKVVFADFSLRLLSGSLTVIMGPSGCGKTTLLNMLMGLTEPDNGRIEGVPSRKAAVFQEDRLCEPFNALANVRMVCAPNVDDSLIQSHLTQLGLAERLSVPVKNLSGGMRRRVAIARAMLADAEIILMDEPFKGLDDKLKFETMDYVKQHRNHRTLIMVTHDREGSLYMDGELMIL